MKLYHYTHLNKWKNIKTGSYVSNHVPGLGNSLRIGTQHPEAVDTTAIFSLLEPTPKSWQENRQFTDTWDRLKSYIGSLLLEIEVDPEDEKVFVIDRAHMEGFVYKDEPKFRTRQPKILRSLRNSLSKKTRASQYEHQTQTAAESAYIGSKVSLKEYLAHKDELGFSLPEVIIAKNVTLDKISISDQQPKLEEELRDSTPEWREEILNEVRKIPELSQWLTEYEYKQEQQEGELSQSNNARRM